METLQYPIGRVDREPYNQGNLRMPTRRSSSILVFVALAALGASAAQTTESLNEAGIRGARARWNRAVEKRDPSALRALLSETYHASGGFGHIAGPDAAFAAARGLFAKRPDLVYVFRPTRIRVIADHGFASEYGEWTEHWTEPSGLTRMRGTYYVVWRFVGGHWLIEGEVNVPESCTGSDYCKPSKKPERSSEE